MKLDTGVNWDYDIVSEESAIVDVPKKEEWQVLQSHDGSHYAAAADPGCSGNVVRKPTDSANFRIKLSFADTTILV